MSKIFARFLKDESGATAIEYGLLAALVALAIIVGATTLGTQLNSEFDTIADKLDGCRQRRPLIYEPMDCANGRPTGRPFRFQHPPTGYARRLTEQRT